MLWFTTLISQRKTHTRTCMYATKWSTRNNYKRAPTGVAMHRLRILMALRPLLASNAHAKGARAIIGDSVAQIPAPSAEAAQISALRSIAAASTRTFASGPPGPNTPDLSAVDGRQNSSNGASTSQPVDEEQPEADWMEDWAKLIDRGDVVGQAELLQNMFGEEPEPIGPPLHELLNYNRKEEERAKRRMFELQKQEQLRKSRQAHALQSCYFRQQLLLHCTECAGSLQAAWPLSQWLSSHTCFAYIRHGLHT